MQLLLHPDAPRYPSTSDHFPKVRDYPQQSRYIPLGGFGYGAAEAKMHDRWMKVNYLLAIGLATFGWL